MTQYPNEPVIRFCDDGMAELVEDYRAWLPGIGRLDISAGFRFDGGSIPRLFWRAVGNPFQGVLLPAFLLHDALYASKCVTRREADSVLLHSAQDLSMLWYCRSPFPEYFWRCQAKPAAIWMAVRVFGRAVWDSHPDGDPAVSFLPARPAEGGR